MTAPEKKLKAGDLVAADGWHIVDVAQSDNPLIETSIAIDALLANPDHFRAVEYSVWNEYEKAKEAFSLALRRVRQCPRVSIAATPGKAQ